MLKQTNNDFRVLFLLEFTKELIRHSPGGIIELQNLIKQEKKELKQELKEKIKETKNLKKQKILEIAPLIKKPFTPKMQKPIIRRMPTVLRIPEPRLPARLSYIKPVPTNVQVDTGKLNPLIKDPMVKIIQCNGSNENIFVEGGMGRKQTTIVLTKEEIEKVIENFSKVAKIPIEEGSTRIVVGRLVLLAVTSKIVSTKFIIKKIGYANRFMR